MKMNGSMRQLLDSMSLSLPFVLADESSESLPEMVTIDGSILLADEYERSRSVSFKDFPDRTGYECFVNHVHVEDYLDDAGLGSNAILKQGIALANKIVEKLLPLFPDKLFKVIVAANESGCSVRFHMIRSGENWLSDDLDKYGQEAILVLETSPI